MNKLTGAALAAGMTMLAAAPAPVRSQAFSESALSAIRYSQSSISPQGSCADMARHMGGDIIHLRARSFAADATTTAHCRVTGIIAPEVAFEVNLPDRWNGRFFMFGNGGHAGEGLDDPGRAAQRAAALRMGFAVAQTNTGHDARAEPGGSFGFNNQQKLIDYAYRAVHLTAVTAKQFAHDYYDQPVKFSYWNACSTGGRQGLMEAQRFPGDFNGIVAGAPVLDFGGKTIGGLWNGRAFDGVPMTEAKLSTMAKASYARCDKIDGLEDGLIDDPRRCDFDPEQHVKRCAEGSDGADCLTAAQATAVKKIYQGVVSQGKPYYPGFSVGSEAIGAGFDGKVTSAWAGMLVSVTGAPPADFALSDSSMKNLVFTKDDLNWDYRKFDFDKDLGQLDNFRVYVDATQADLSEFRSRGGKLLMYYGWADQLLPPMMGVNYYERALQANGPDTKEFFRFFTAPGMFHCQGGVGPDRFDAVTAVVNWVENGVAPASLKATQMEAGKVKRTRPLCPYPDVARYSGKGDVNDAANFSCRAPL
jgi:Tannase and feruloyl esterase